MIEFKRNLLAARVEKLIVGGEADWDEVMRMPHDAQKDLVMMVLEHDSCSQAAAIRGWECILMGPYQAKDFTRVIMIVAQRANKCRTFKSIGIAATRIILNMNTRDIVFSWGTPALYAPTFFWQLIARRKYYRHACGK